MQPSQPSIFTLVRSSIPRFALHLARGLAPYAKIEEKPRENASTFPGLFFYFSARLVALRVLIR